MRIAVIFAILTFLSSCTLYETDFREPANIFYRDDRKSLPRIDFPQWGSIHKTPQREHPWGTAFLIDSCYIGTAYHNITKINLEITGDEVLYFDNPLRDKAIQATPVKWGRPTEASQKQLNSEDWAILKLSECFSPEEVEPLVLYPLPREKVIEHPLILAGFPQDYHPNNITVDFECFSGPRVLKRDNSIGHDCASRPGNSGSPLISREPGKENHVVAVVVASLSFNGMVIEEVISEYSDFFANKACPVAPMARALQELKE